MKSYFLRRNRVENGPFSLEELMALELKSGDMIRTGDDNKIWQTVEEIEELKTNYDIKQARQKKFWFASKTLNCFSFIANSSSKSHISWFLVVVAVLLFDFIIIRSIVEGFNNETQYYTAIRSAFQKEPVPKEKVDNNIQNALVKEIVASPDTNIKIKKTLPTKDEILSISELRNLLQVKSNKYQVVSTGGIDDLKLTVYNLSPYFVEAVTIQIDYLKNRKRLVQTESFTTTYIKPNSSKTIHIPSNTKGKKIKYRITNVQASECKLRKFEI